MLELYKCVSIGVSTSEGTIASISTSASISAVVHVPVAEFVFILLPLIKMVVHFNIHLYS